MFMAVVGLGVLALHLYLWKRLVRDTTTTARARKIGTVVLGVFALLAVAALVLPRFVGVDIAAWFAWPGYLWLALFFYLLLVLAVLELPRLALRKWTKPAEETDESRRLFLSRAAAVVAGAASASIVGAGTVSALGPPAVKRVTVPIGGLATGLRGFRIAVVSDIHLGPLMGRAHTERIVRMINETQPDLVAMVGDLADGTVAELGGAAAPLGDLEAPTYFVTGNHEYYSGYQPWVTELERLGLHYLHNENTRISRGTDAFTLAGVTDVTGKSLGDGPDMKKAVAGRVGATVLLAHQPVQLEQAVDLGVDLQLSGHTHGGQLWPFHYLVRAAQPAVSGLSKVDNTWLYVTNGAGSWGPPVRVGAEPDISVVELTPGA
ncbi:metallophosphoesterase [Actinokineospora globicatena]|uniref:Metallophosphatase n=1 Tax=Actinokineospora globicatena TaxID=103729 RepID=A0A9W6QPU8_9PSEU|nr:metallophosphoesterase [Actinokineospora globicatena]GLW92443.1 metallophosphatase [Actinokineospora globicatena]